MQTKNKHASELMFTVTLFAVFLICAVLLVLFGANVYQKTTSELSVNETTRVSLSYIQEKVRQCDHSGSISAETVDKTQTLALYTDYGDETYVTYIYYDSGSLKELFIKSSLDFNSAAGSVITDIEDFSVTSDGALITIRLTDTDGTLHELYVHATSQA